MEDQRSKETLRPVSVLLRETFGLYIAKAPTLLGILGIPIGILAVLSAMINLMWDTHWAYSPWFSVVAGGCGLVSILSYIWTTPALLYAFKEDIGVIEAYKKAWGILLPFLWVYVLVSAIVAGGFLLLIIPGIVFAVWFFSANMVVLFEGKTGFDALIRSRELVRGKFWPVLIRKLVFWLLFLVLIGLLMSVCPILDRLCAGKCVVPLWRYFVHYWIIMPFSLVYDFLLYEDLKRVEPEGPCVVPSNREWLKYAFPGVVGLVVLILGAGLLLLNVFLGRDIPPVDDSDLRLVTVQVPKEEDAYYPLRQAVENMYLPEDKEELFWDMAAGREWDPDFAEELVEKNKKTFEYFNAALKCKYFQGPEFDWESVFESELRGNKSAAPSKVSLMIDVGKLVMVKARYLAAQGRGKEAMKLAEHLIKISRVIMRGKWQLWDVYSLGWSYDLGGVRILRDLLPQVDLTSEEVKGYISLLEEAKIASEVYVNLIKALYRYVMEFGRFLLKEANFSHSSPGICRDNCNLRWLCVRGRLCYWYKPNKTRKMFAEYARRMIAYVNNSCCYAVEPPEPKDVVSSQWPGENLLGRMHFEILSDLLLGVRSRSDHYVIATQILFALKAYAMEHGELPETLEALVPEYLPEVPKDPFDGKPVRYSPEKKIIYFVGRDLKDSGGSLEEDSKIDDPTFRIKF